MTMISSLEKERGKMDADSVEVMRSVIREQENLIFALRKKVRWLQNLLKKAKKIEVV